MDELLERVRSLDPAVALELATPLPLAAGAALLVAGLLIAVFGSHRWIFRFVATALGAGVGWLAGPFVAKLSGLDVRLASIAAAAGLAILGAALPAAQAFVIVGAGGALIGHHVSPPEDALVGAVAGFALAGGLAAVLFHFIAGVISALLGGALVAIGATSIALGTGAADLVKAHPWLGLLVGAIVFVAGTAYQVTRPDEETRAKRDEEKRAAAEKKKQEKEAQKRWEKYAGKGR